MELTHTEKDLLQIDFLSYLNRKGLSERSMEHYMGYYKRLMKIMELSEEDIDQDIVNSFLDLHPNNVARAFMKNYLDYRDMNQLRIQKITGRKEKKEVEQIPDSHIQLIRKAMYQKGNMYGILFDITEACALRRTEALFIKTSDITVENIKGKDCMFILLKKTKGNKQRKVFVPNTIAIRVIKYIGIKNLNVGDYLFASPKFLDRPIDDSQWNELFHRLSLKTTGIAYHPHQLRHHRSLKWHEAGIDITRIQHRLGHSSISTTALYINPDKRKELERWSQEDS